MAKNYKVWIEVEEIDEENDHYENVQQNELASFNDMGTAMNCASLIESSRKSSVDLAMIADIMSGSYWNADTMQAVCEILTEAGFEIKEPEED